MADPDPAVTAVFNALYQAGYGMTSRDSLKIAVDAARPLIEAEARAAERRSIRQLAIERRAIFIEYQEGLSPFVGDFADLLDGDDDE